MDGPHCVYLSSTNGHLGCFYLWPVWICCCEHRCANICLRPCFLFIWVYVYPGVSLLQHMFVLCLIFWQLSRLLPCWLHQFAFPVTGHDGANCPTSSPVLALFWFLTISILMGIYPLFWTLFLCDTGGENCLVRGHSLCAGLSLILRSFASSGRYRVNVCPPLQS